MRNKDDIRKDFTAKVLKEIYLKDFKFYKYICEMYILADIKKNCRHQDLYRNKGDFGFFLNTKNSYFLMQKILYFMRISVKCIFWQI